MCRTMSSPAYMAIYIYTCVGLYPALPTWPYIYIHV